MKKKTSNILRTKKIMYIHKSGSGWGGAQQNLYELVHHFRDKFGETIFVCNNGMLLERVRALKIRTYKIPIASKKLFPVTLYALAKILIKEKPDLIHSNHRYVTLLVQLLRKFLPIRYKILHTARSVFNSYTWCRFLGDKTIANSKAVEQNLIEKFHLSAGKIETIYDGVALNLNSHILLNRQNDPVFQLLDCSERPIIGCIGSLVKAKGHCYLFRAISQLPEAIKNNMLVLIIGDGPLRHKLEDLAAELGISNTVKFLGFRRDVHLLISYCNFLVIPSIQEGLPNVLIEGYLLEKPSIVSELDYVHELLTPHKIGVTFPPKNVDRLAEAIQCYLENPQLVKKHGKKGKRLFRRMFNLKTNLKNYTRAYQALLEMA